MGNTNNFRGANVDDNPLQVLAELKLTAIEFCLLEGSRDISLVEGDRET